MKMHYRSGFLGAAWLGATLVFSPAAVAQDSINAGSTRSVHIAATDGQVRVRGWDRPAIQIERRDNSAEASSLQEGDQLRVSPKTEGGLLKIDLFVPSNMELQIETRGAAVAVQGMSGLARITTQTGTIDVIQPAGAVVASSESGAIRALFAQNFSAAAELTSKSGNIHITSPPRLRVRATSGNPIFLNGAVKVTGFTAETGYALDVAADAAGGQIQASARAGRVIVEQSSAPVPAQAPPVAAEIPTANSPASARATGAPFPGTSRMPETAPAGQGPMGSTRPADNGNIEASGSGDRAGSRVPTSENRPTDKYRVVGSTVDAGYAVRTSVDFVNLNVSVRDRSNRSIAHLRKQDFQVYEDGKLQAVDNLLTAEMPFHLLLLLDVSGSTSEYVELMKSASINFLRMLKPDDEVALAVFSSYVDLVVPFSRDRSDLEYAIRGIHSQGGTSFYDALDTSVHEYMGGVRGRKAIVVFSDGVDNQLEGRGSGSSVTFSQLIRGVKESDSIIYPIFLDTEDDQMGGGMGRVIIDILGGGMPRRSPFPSRGDRRGQYARARQELEEIAEQTGGRMYSPRRIDDLEGTYRQIADDLRVQYTLSYASSNPADDGRWRRIQVRIQSHPDYAVRTRTGYYAKGGADENRAAR